MRCDCKWVQVSENRDSAEGNLKKNSDQLTDCQRANVGALEAYDSDQGNYGDREKSKGYEAVPELNPDMELTLRLVGDWRERPARAFGPCGAP